MVPLEASCPHPRLGSFPALRNGGLAHSRGTRDSAGCRLESGGPEAATRGHTPHPPRVSCNTARGAQLCPSPRVRRKVCEKLGGRPGPRGFPAPLPPTAPGDPLASPGAPFPPREPAGRGRRSGDCGSRGPRRPLEGVGGQRGALTASWGAHCGAAPGAHGAHPGAGGGGGRAPGAAATSLQERAAGVMARAG